MINYTKLIASISILILTLNGSVPEKIPNHTIERKMFQELNEVVSKDFNFNFIDFDATGRDIVLTYGVINNNGKDEFININIKTGSSNDLNDAVRQSGLDKKENKGTLKNNLTNRVILDIYDHAISNEKCLKNFIEDANNNLKVGQLLIETRDEGTALIYLEPQYNVGASSACLYLLNPIRLVKGLMVQ